MSNSLFGDIDLTEVIGNETIRQRFQAGAEQITGEEVVGGEPPAVDGEPIEDWHDLDAVREDPDADYVLVNDLDEDTDGYDQVVESTENDGNGFDPIGSGFSSDPFGGVFVGDGHAISDLSINPEQSDLGLFAETTENAEIRNVNIQNISVTGGTFNVGGLVGENNGSIENSSVAGEIDGDASDVGGLVGVNNDNGSIESSYVIGNVGGDSFSVDIGGLVGENDGTITRSYAAGGVDSDGTSADIGGLVGENDGTVEDSYWDTEATEQDSSSGGEGLTTAEMQGETAPENMDDLDFEDTWEAVVSGESIPPTPDEDGYPILQDIDAEPQLEAQGLIDD